jgi:hypothetical protein
MAEPRSQLGTTESLLDGQRQFARGQRALRQAAGLDGIKWLFERHATEWPHARPLEKYVLDGLRRAADVDLTVDQLMSTVLIYPEEVEWRRYLSLALEQSGKIDAALQMRYALEHEAPGTIENQAAIVRLSDLKFDRAIDASCKLRNQGNAWTLALSRRLAISPGQTINPQKLGELRDTVRELLLDQPNDISLHLASGFIALAYQDASGVFDSFCEASLLARHQQYSVQGKHQKFDPWALAYAEAFLLGQAQSFNALVLPDKLRLALAHGARLRSKRNTLAALATYGHAVSALLSGHRPICYQLYGSHIIVRDRQRLHAVPQMVRRFSIMDGVVVYAPRLEAGNDSTRGWLVRLAAHISPAIRFRIKATVRYGLVLLASKGCRVPLLRALWRFHYGLVLLVSKGCQVQLLRALWRCGVVAVRPLYGLARHVARRLYIRLYAVPGVLTDFDPVRLQERVDRMGVKQPVERT